LGIIVCRRDYVFYSRITIKRNNNAIVKTSLLFSYTNRAINYFRAIYIYIYILYSMYKRNMFGYRFKPDSHREINTVWLIKYARLLSSNTVFIRVRLCTLNPHIKFSSRVLPKTVIWSLVEWSTFRLVYTSHGILYGLNNVTLYNTYTYIDTNSL